MVEISLSSRMQHTDTVIMNIHTGMLEKGKGQVHAQNISEEVTASVNGGAGWNIMFGREPPKVSLANIYYSCTHVT